jgi:hypothetical protein
MGVSSPLFALAWDLVIIGVLQGSSRGEDLGWGWEAAVGLGPDSEEAWGTVMRAWNMGHI